MTRLLLGTLTTLLMVVSATADERLKGIACRSVHLRYPAPEGTTFLNEIRVDESAPGTYFMVCGWNKGYFGLQELANGKKLLIFSVWDSGQNDPNKVAPEKRTKLIDKHENTRIGRFGGEGSGGQSFYDFDWERGTTYRFMVTSTVNGDRTEYTGYFFAPEPKEWIRMVTFSTITGGKNLSGYYAFVEDFKRDRVSTTKVRRAEYGNGWVRTTKHEWVPLTRARFTADQNPVLNIDAGIEKDWFYLTTGGDTSNTGTELWKFMDMPKQKQERPEGLPTE